jgi:hypothetical protein
MGNFQAKRLSSPSIFALNIGEFTCRRFQIRIATIYALRNVNLTESRDAESLREIGLRLGRDYP